jgi:hypothetical protein
MGNTGPKLALVAIVATSGCSFAFVQRAAPSAPAGPETACTTSRVAPIADAVLGGALLLTAVGVGSSSRLDPTAQQVVVPLYGLAGLGTIYGSYVGFRETARCARLHAGIGPAVAAAAAPPALVPAPMPATPAPVAMPATPAPMPAPPATPAPVPATPAPMAATPAPPAPVPAPMSATPAPVPAPPAPMPATPATMPATPATPAPMPPAPAADLLATGEVEVAADFTALGVLGAITVIDARDLGDDRRSSLLVLAGAAGGAVTGWLLADRTGATRGDGHATSFGLGLGLANAALLLVPLDRAGSSEQVLPMLLAGGTLGAIGGLAVARHLELTRGQTLFAMNLTLLGLGTTGIATALLDRDGRVGRGEYGLILAGLDGGAAAGLIAGAHVDWSARRARFALATTTAGLLLGSLAATGLARQGASNRPDPDAVALGMLGGMYGGFALGAVLSRGWAPDAPAASPAVVVAPLTQAHTLGLAIGGQF